jgi:hypothetical protein
MWRLDYYPIVMRTIALRDPSTARVNQLTFASGPDGLRPGIVVGAETADGRVVLWDRT